MSDRTDQELIREYAARGAEDAFCALVKRHTSLVYATARRKLGDATAAEEITQQVFVTLARKAPFLCHRANLAGWLHEATMHECRQYLRTELRRRRREETAMQMHEPKESKTALAAELDDAMLELAPKDRQPLLLRFFEGLGLREVGRALGINEDAAQKRVAKSLSLLEKILCKRGRDVGVGALAVILAESAEAAPAHLAVTAAHAALVSGSAATTIGVVFGKFMALPKLQSAAVAIALLGAPLLLQSQKLSIARIQDADARASLALYEKQNAGTAEIIQRLQRERTRVEEERKVLASAVANPTAKPMSPADYKRFYRWSDASPYVRLPKSLLQNLWLTSEKQRQPELGALREDPLQGIDRTDTLGTSGIVSDAMAEALGFSDQERAAVGDAVRTAAERFAMIAAQNTILTNTMPPGIGFNTDGAQLYTLLTKEFPEQGEKLKQELKAELENAIGAERAEIVMGQAQNVFDREFQGFGKHQRFLAAAARPDGMITVGQSQSENGNSTGGWVSTMPWEKVPDQLKPYFPKTISSKP